MSRVAPLLIVTDDYDHALHAEMAKLRYDHEKERRRACLLALLLPMAALLLGIEYIGGAYTSLTLTVLTLVIAIAL